MKIDRPVCAGDDTLDSLEARDRAHLGAMKRYAQLANEFAKTWTADNDDPDRVTFLAISYCLGIIGGAACQVSAAAVPVAGREQWPRVMALRDRIRDYRSVTPSFVSSTVQKDIPPLIAALDFMPEGDAR